MHVRSPRESGPTRSFGVMSITINGRLRLGGCGASRRHRVTRSKNQKVIGIRPLLLEMCPILRKKSFILNRQGEPACPSPLGYVYEHALIHTFNPYSTVCVCVNFIPAPPGFLRNAKRNRDRVLKLIVSITFYCDQL